jgi:hypothetical protein
VNNKDVEKQLLNMWYVRQMCSDLAAGCRMQPYNILLPECVLDALKSMFPKGETSDVQMTRMSGSVLVHKPEMHCVLKNEVMGTAKWWTPTKEERKEILYWCAVNNTLLDDRNLDNKLMRWDKCVIKGTRVCVWQHTVRRINAVCADWEVGDHTGGKGQASFYGHVKHVFTLPVGPDHVDVNMVYVQWYGNVIMDNLPRESTTSRKRIRIVRDDVDKPDDIDATRHELSCVDERNVHVHGSVMELDKVSHAVLLVRYNPLSRHSAVVHIQ